MPMPSFISTGTIVSDVTGAAALTPVPPTHVVNDILFYTGDFSKFKFIEVSASTKVNVSFYR